MFIFLNVEKFSDLDRKAIVADQKAKVLAAGGEWIEPEERAKMEEAENARLVEEARIEQLKKDCAKKGLVFEDEEAKYQAAKAEKDAAAAKKKEEAEAKKAAKEADKKAKEDALSQEEKDARAKKAAEVAEKKAKHDKEVESEFEQIRADNASLRAQLSE